MEHCQFGDLGRLIRAYRDNNLRFGEEQVTKLIIQLVNGLEYAHHSNKVHQDLKPQNVFLTGRGGIKIGDFGASEDPYWLQKYYGPQSRKMVGTPVYMAPEIWRQESSS